MKKLIFASIAAVHVFLLIGFFTVNAGADTNEIAKHNSGRAVITYENNLIAADIDQAPLSVVVKKIEKQTGAHFVLKDTSILNYPLSINIKEVKLEDAMKRIFKHYSYVTYYDADGKVDKVVIFSAKAGAIKATDKQSPGSLGSQTLPSTSGTVSSALTEESDQKLVSKGEMSQSDAASQQTSNKEKSDAEQEESPDELLPDTADVPYDLDEYQPLYDGSADAGVSSTEPDMEDPQGMRLSAEEQAARESRMQQQRLERSLSAINSEHTHLRTMAVEELVTVKDPRATTALANAASSQSITSEERRQAAQALWHHAADYQFADSTANGALVQLANDGDPAVREIARRALVDMERYQRRNSGN